MSAPDADEATLRYLDGVADEAEVAALAERLRAQPELRRGFVRTAHLHALLAELAPQPLVIARPRRERRAFAAVATAAAAALVALAAYRLGGEPPAARVAALHGGVACWRAGARRALADGAALVAGDRLRVDAAGSVELACAGARVVVAGDSDVAIGERGGATLRLDHGALGAWVFAHPAGARFAIATPDAVATDIGTNFDVRRDADGTLVVVDTGTVELVAANGSVVVPAGRRALAPPGRAPQLVDAPAIAAPRRSATDADGTTTITGTVTAVEPREHRLVVRDDATGTTETYRPWFAGGAPTEPITHAVGALKVGDRVTLRYRLDEGCRIVSLAPAR